MNLLADKLIQADVPTVNGRVYERKELETAIEKYRSGLRQEPLICDREGNPCANTHPVFSIINIELDSEGYVNINCRIINSIIGPELKDSIQRHGRDQWILYPVVSGVVETEGNTVKVKDFVFTGVGVSAKGKKDV